MIGSDRVFGFNLHRCAKKVVIIDFNRLNWLINRQLSSNIDFNRLIDYIFDDRFRSIRYALMYMCTDNWQDSRNVINDYKTKPVSWLSLNDGALHLWLSFHPANYPDLSANLAILRHFGEYLVAPSKRPPSFFSSDFVTSLSPWRHFSVFVHEDIPISTKHSHCQSNIVACVASVFVEQRAKKRAFPFPIYLGS